MRAEIAQMRRQGRGAIVNTSSMLGDAAMPDNGAYIAAKHGVNGLTRAAAVELAGIGIRVNAVAPGVVDTQLWAKNKAIPGVVEETTALIPLGRWGTPEDVADVIAFLASDAARYVTAQTISVDGGMAQTTDLYGGAV